MASSVPYTNLLSAITRVLWRCLLEARPAVQGIFALRFLSGASFSAPPLSVESGVAVGAGTAVWMCAMSAVYLLNGAMDITEDRANRSARPVARGELTVRQASVAAVTLGGLGVAGGYALDTGIALGAAAVLVLGWVYSCPPLRLKRWPSGLAVVVLLAGLITYHAGYFVGGGTGVSADLAVFAVVMSLWMGLVGQTKDLSDVAGDWEAGRRSLPVVCGERAARRYYAVTALALSEGYLVWTALAAENLLVSGLVLAAGAGAVAIVALGREDGNRAVLRRPYRTFMLTQYAVHLAVVLGRL